MTDHKHDPSCSLPGVDTCPGHAAAARRERIHAELRKAAQHEPEWETARRDEPMACSCGEMIPEATWEAVDAHRAEVVLASAAVALIRAETLDEAYAITTRRGLYETGIDILARAAEYEAEAARG